MLIEMLIGLGMLDSKYKPLCLKTATMTGLPCIHCVHCISELHMLFLFLKIILPLLMHC